MNDLISRAALINDLSYCAPELFFDKDYLVTKIMKQPTVDAAPVVHARWVEEPGRKNHWHCSNCGVVEGLVCKLVTYCRFCGAIMDGGDADESK